MKKKKMLNEDEFKQWLKTHHNIDFDSIQAKKSYETNVNSVHRSAGNNKFILELGQHLQEWEKIYNKGKSYSLCMFRPGLDKVPELELQKKELSSMINKAYRFNCVNNKYFEEAPNWESCSRKDWLTPDNWFQEINDTVRSKIICKYADGPEFLARHLENWADECNLIKRTEPKQKEEGYYNTFANYGLAEG